MEEQSEIADRRWQAELDRELEEMDAIESHFVRFVRPRFAEPRVEPTRPQVVECEFEGLAEEVIRQFLQSEPPHCRPRHIVPRWVEADPDGDSEQSLSSHEDSSEQLIYGCGNNLSGRPMVDSGAFTSCCPRDYAREVQVEPAPPLHLKSVLGEKIQHYLSLIHI